jgi:hypothetical protein
MTGTTDQSGAGDILICHLLATSAGRASPSRDHENHYVDSFDPIAIPPLRQWDKARRAQGRPPTFEEFLEAYWVGLGCLRWLVGLSRFYVCEGCGELMTESELPSHAARCATVTETQEARIPDPPEEIYRCPDEECGFWSTEYTDIRAPHRSKAHGGMHSSHSFILEDDADTILDLWLQRHSTRVMEVCRCRLCEAGLSPGRSALDHFLKHHATAYTGDDLWKKVITRTNLPGKKFLCDLICRTLRERGIRELSVVFSPSLQRAYRENIVSGQIPIRLAGSVLSKDKWIDNVVDVIDSYFESHLPSHSAVDVSHVSNRPAAQRLSRGQLVTHSPVNSYRSVKIWIRFLFRLLSGDD